MREVRKAAGWVQEMQEAHWAVQRVAVAVADCGLTTDHHRGRRFILTNVASQQAYKVGITILNL